MKTSSRQRYYAPGVPLPEDCHVQVSKMIDNRTLLCQRGEVEGRLAEELTKSLADYVRSSRVTVLQHDDMGCQEYKLDVYVFSPLYFHQIVEAEVARRMALEYDLLQKVKP